MFRHRSKLILSALALLLIPALAAGEDNPLHHHHGGAPAMTTPSDEPTPDARDPREHLMLLLSGHHGIPSREELESAVPNVRELLWEIAHEEDQHPIQQDRAIAALAWWGDEAVQELYARLIESPDTRNMLRHRAIALAGEHFGEEAFDRIAPIVRHQDLQLRITAIDALTRIDPERARLVLQPLLETTTEPLVRERIEQSLQMQ